MSSGKVRYGRWRDPPAKVRVAIAGSMGVLAGVIVSAVTLWQAATLIGWDVGALWVITWIWWVVGSLDAEECKTHASKEDTRLRLSELMVLSAGLAVLAVVGLALVRAGMAAGVTKAEQENSQIALPHALLSSVFGAVIIALVINVVASLLR